MLTKDENGSFIIKHLNACAYNWRYLYVYKDLFVVKAEKTYAVNRRTIRYLANTHRDLSGFITIDYRMNLKPDLYWSSGGIISNVSPHDVAVVMNFAWEDVQKVLELSAGEPIEVAGEILGKL